jgi:hypothetical protein
VGEKTKKLKGPGVKFPSLRMSGEYFVFRDGSRLEQAKKTARKDESESGRGRDVIVKEKKIRNKLHVYLIELETNGELGWDLGLACFDPQSMTALEQRQIISEHDRRIKRNPAH